MRGLCLAWCVLAAGVFAFPGLSPRYIDSVHIDSFFKAGSFTGIAGIVFGPDSINGMKVLQGGDAHQSNQLIRYPDANGCFSIISNFTVERVATDTLFCSARVQAYTLEGKSPAGKPEKTWLKLGKDGIRGMYAYPALERSIHQRPFFYGALGGGLLVLLLIFL